MNARYGIKSKASVDPFTAMPTYSQKFVREERTLPDWSARPLCREMFPAELLDTIEPEDGGGVRKKRRLQLSKVSALPNAEEAFGLPPMDVAGQADGTAGNGQDLLEKLEALKDEEGDEGAGLEEEEGLEEEDEDEIYDDEDAGDYDAENYFDNGDDMGDEYGDGDDGEGTY